ncbi:phytanoyl-CoA dioxygenase family protein [Rhodococcus sp. NPDC059968]|uniref:phytanoyl-CoA dioxygenase family protein n=1 Tax=Rhodococcus sp. NPDC059968 TaxID=3347017 RepID=UPI0036709A32
MTTDHHSEHPTEQLRREITDEERAEFAANGVIRLEAVIPPAWIDYLRTAVDRMMTDVHSTSQNYTSAGQPRFFSQAFPRFIDSAFNSWALRGPTKDIARQMHSSARSLRFFYDQVFAQEPGSGQGAPFHQDYAYLPVDGAQYFRIWVPLDTVTTDSGAIHYLKGSHLGPVYRPRSFSGNPDVAAVYQSSPFPESPDFDADYDQHQWFIGEAEPGDALLHHPKTVHGSRANHSSRSRRAVTTIFTGDQVVWDPRPGTSFDHLPSIGGFSVPPMTPGTPIGGDLFPVVWHETPLHD